MKALRATGGRVLHLGSLPRRQPTPRPQPTAIDLRQAAASLLAAPPIEDAFALLGAAGELEIAAGRLDAQPGNDRIQAEANAIAERMRAAA